MSLGTGTVGRQSELLILRLNCKLSLTLRQQSPAGSSVDPVGKHSMVPLDPVNTRDASSERGRQADISPATHTHTHTPSIMSYGRRLGYRVLYSLSHPAGDGKQQ